MGLLGAAIGVGFVAGPALGDAEVGGGPVHRTPFLLAVTFRGAIDDIADEGARRRADSVSQNAEGLAVRVGSLLRSPLAPYALVSLALNLSFAQVEASFVLVLRDYLDFGAQQTAGCSPMSGCASSWCRRF